MHSLRNVLNLVGKELRALLRDRVMLALILFVFTVSTYIVADAITTEVRDVAVAVVDEDQSILSQRLADAIGPPLFRKPDLLQPKAAELGLRQSRYILVVSFPPEMQRDIVAGKSPELLIDVDATAVAQAGNSATDMQLLLTEEVRRFLDPSAAEASLVNPVMQNRFNPNLTSKWFSSVMQLMNSITIITLILSGASLIREREHGTIEHVMVMPVRPHEILFSKILANGAVIVLATVLSLFLVVKWLLGVPVSGSTGLFVTGVAIYVVAVSSIGLLLSTFTSSMGQFGLLVIPVIIVMILLSGGMTPIESMPAILRDTMRLISPAPHFVSFTQSVLYRGSGIVLVWTQLAAMTVMAGIALAITLMRFRKVLAA